MRNSRFFFLVIALALASTVRPAPFLAVADLQAAYSYLLDPSSLCQFRKVALLTDKPVYRNGETIYITAFPYSGLDKVPLNRCSLNKFMRV